MAPIKYVGGTSTGTPLELGETRSVVVTAEAVDPTAAYSGDSVTYTATVKNDLEAGLPVTFVVDLEVNGTKVITGQALDAGVYTPETGALILPFTCPDLVGAKTVKLVWTEQMI